MAMTSPRPNSGSNTGANGLAHPTAPLSNPSSSSSNFRTRALAITAAHRLASQTSNVHTSPPPQDPENGYGATRESDVSSGSSTALKQPQDKYKWVTPGLSSRTGDEPGVDVKSRRDEQTYGHLKARSSITVVDYCSDPDGKNTRVEFDGAQLNEWLDSEDGKRGVDENGRPDGVRWIHVDKINWEVIKTLVQRFRLHPLAVEDALQAENSHRSKIDFYKSHLYFQILIQHVNPSDETILSEAADEMALGRFEERFDPFNDRLDAHHRSHSHQGASYIHRGSHAGLAGGEGQDAAEQGAAGKRKRKDLANGSALPPGIPGVFDSAITQDAPSTGRTSRNRAAYQMTIAQLTAKYMIPVRKGVLSAFMTRDGTMITMMDHTIKDALDPIYGRLEDSQSLLRTSGDVSMLAQAFLDVSVDLALEVASAFEAEILNLEASVLVDPSIKTVRHLHVLSAQLIRLRRSLLPILRLTSVIRDQDSQRSAAAANLLSKVHHQNSDLLPPQFGPNGYVSSSRVTTPHLEKENPLNVSNMSGYGSISRAASPAPVPTPGVLGVPSSQPMAHSGSDGVASVGEAQAYAHGQSYGFFSPLAKVYVVDVIDHLENALNSLDSFIGTCEHLTDYVFNVLSFQTNGSMERLSIVTVVFLPLTFIASYFGMNFDGFDQLHGPVSYFWKIAIPTTVGFFIVFSFSYLKMGVTTSARKLARWRQTRALESRGKLGRVLWGRNYHRRHKSH